jgi:hypothetical protein
LRSLVLVGLVVMVALTASPVMAGLDERVVSAGDFAKDAVQAAAVFDAQGVYDSAAAYEQREGAYAYATYTLVAAFAEEQAGTAGPLGDWAAGALSGAGGVVTQSVDDNSAAARHGVNSCFDGFLPGLGWEQLRFLCVAQREAAETILGQPLPEL